MSTDQSSHEFLAHFDRPTGIVSPAFEWDETNCGAAEFDPAAAEPAANWRSLETRDAELQPPAARISAWCVCQWAGAIAVLAIAVSVLAEFGQGIAAESALRIAARAGAIEATLPKATYASVAATIGRRLAAYPELKQHIQVALSKNGTPVVERFFASGGDQISVTISVPASSLASPWVRMISPHHNESTTIVQAESKVPVRKLRQRAS